MVGGVNAPSLTRKPPNKMAIARDRKNLGPCSCGHTSQPGHPRFSPETETSITLLWPTTIFVPLDTIESCRLCEDCDYGCMATGGNSGWSSLFLKTHRKGPYSLSPGCPCHDPGVDTVVFPCRGPLKRMKANSSNLAEGRDGQPGMEEQDGIPKPLHKNTHDCLCGMGQ